MRRLAITASAALVMMLAFTARADDPATARYLGGFADSAAVCDVNTACFALEGATGDGTVLIHDATGLPVGAHAVYKAGSIEVGRRAFCGGEELTGPADATVLEIRIQEVPGCGPGTTGVISFG